jgi:hypothetical protein
MSNSLGEGLAIGVRVAVLHPELAAAGGEVVLLAVGRVLDDVAGTDRPAFVVDGARRGRHLGMHGSADAALVGSAGDGSAGDGAFDSLGRVRGAGPAGCEVDGRAGGLELQLEGLAGSHGSGAGDVRLNS